METLKKLFGPLVEIYFTTKDGISLSQVNRIKGENQQANQVFLTLLGDAKKGVNLQKMKFVGPGADGGFTEIPSGKKIQVTDLDPWNEVAKRNAQTSVLMVALKFHKECETKLRTIAMTPFIEGVVIPEDLPKPASASNGIAEWTENNFFDSGNIDDLLRQMTPECLAASGFTGDFVQKATMLNAQAAVLGKMLSEKGAFFRKLSEPVPDGSQSSVQTGVMVTIHESQYSEEERAKFETYRATLQERYDSLQRQLNGYKKQIKDAVRKFAANELSRYNSELAAYHKRKQEIREAEELLRSEAEVLRSQAQRELANLKIKSPKVEI